MIETLTPLRAVPARPVSIPALITRFEGFITGNSHNCVEHRVNNCPAARQLTGMKHLALLAIAGYLLSDESGHVQTQSELREAFVRLLDKIALENNIEHKPTFMFDVISLMAWALWADTKGSIV